MPGECLGCLGNAGNAQGMPFWFSLSSLGCLGLAWASTLTGTCYRNFIVRTLFFRNFIFKEHFSGSILVGTFWQEPGTLCAFTRGMPGVCLGCLGIAGECPGNAFGNWPGNAWGMTEECPDLSNHIGTNEKCCRNVRRYCRVLDWDVIAGYDCGTL
jgi:hypothetical protein